MMHMLFIPPTHAIRTSFMALLAASASDGTGAARRWEAYVTASLRHRSRWADQGPRHISITGEGDEATRTVLIEFPSAEAAVTAYNSADYRDALAVLGDAAEREIRVLNGL